MARWGVDVWFVSFGPCFGGDRASAEGAWPLPPLSRRICVDRVDRFVICQCGSDMMITLLGCIEVHKMLHQKKGVYKMLLNPVLDFVQLVHVQHFNCIIVKFGPSTMLQNNICIQGLNCN